MSIIPNDEGGDIMSHPFVTIYEKLIDGLAFRYAEYKNEAYIVVKDAATQINHTDPVSSAKKFHERYKILLPNSFKKFKVFTPGGPQNFLFANLNAINIFCSRTKNREEAVKYITKLTQFQKWFYSTQTTLAFNEEQASLQDKLQGDYNFLSSEVKFLHKERNIDRRNITALAQAVKQLQTQFDTNITGHQKEELYDLLNKKLAVIVAEKRGLAKPTPQVYKDIWTAFYKCFKIVSYHNLPASKFEDAKEYLLYQIEKITKELE